MHFFNSKIGGHKNYISPYLKSIFGMKTVHNKTLLWFDVLAN